MKSKDIQAVNELRKYLDPNKRLPKELKEKIEIVLNGFNQLDQEVKQKEQLLIQKEKELKAFRAGVDNSSKNTRDVINESKQHLDKAESLYQAGNFSEALKYSNKALYSIGDIDSLEVKTVEQANELYIEKKQQHTESEAKKDYLYNNAVVNDKNAFGWVKENPTRCFYSFFKDVLKVPDNTADNIRIINKLYELLPLYVEEAQRTNHFYNEYNKYNNAMTKLQQVVNIYNIRAASSKGLKDYEGALKSCEIALEIEPKSSTLLNLKNAVLKEKQGIEAKKLKEKELLVGKDKLISDKDQEIEFLKALLARKELEKKELLDQKEKEISLKEKENSDLKTLNLARELESQKNKELLNQKEVEVLIKNLFINQSQAVINELQEKIVLKDNENAHLKAVNKQLSHIEIGCQVNGNEVACQVDLGGNITEDLL